MRGCPAPSSCRAGCRIENSGPCADVRLLEALNDDPVAAVVPSFGRRLENAPYAELPFCPVTDEIRHHLQRRAERIERILAPAEFMHGGVLQDAQPAGAHAAHPGAQTCARIIGV